MPNTPRMRFAQDAYNQLKQDDPGTTVTLGFIRSIARQGLVPYIQIGRRRLLNYDALLDYLQGQVTPVPPAPANRTSGKRDISAPGIRPIPER